MAWGSRIVRAALAGLILLLLSIPHPAAAAPASQIVLTFDVVGVKKSDTFTIRTERFPVRTNFVVLVDKPGKQAAGGVQVGEFFSDKGGELEFTYQIPETLSDALIIAVRVESRDGYLATGWFFNRDMPYKPADPKVKPEITFSSVKRNQSVTVEGKNFPPGYRFSVRIGPSKTFYRDYRFLDSVTSNDDGTVRFEIELPEALHDSQHIMVRLDGAGLYAYNNYENVDGGAAVPENKLHTFQWCQLIDTRPIPALSPGEEFDVVWTLQNTSNMVWETGTVDYKWAGGEKMHKYNDRYDLNWEVGRGWTFQIRVDMIAPSDFAGWHSTTWAVVRDNTEMCRMKVSVFVKDN